MKKSTMWNLGAAVAVALTGAVISTSLPEPLPDLAPPPETDHFVARFSGLKPGDIKFVTIHVAGSPSEIIQVDEEAQRVLCKLLVAPTGDLAVVWAQPSKGLVIEYRGSSRLNMNGWMLYNGAGDLYVIKNVTLNMGQRVKFHVGPGTDNDSGLMHDRFGLPPLNATMTTVVLLDWTGKQRMIYRHALP